MGFNSIINKFFINKEYRVYKFRKKGVYVLELYHDKRWVFRNFVDNNFIHKHLSSNQLKKLNNNRSIYFYSNKIDT